MKGMERVCRNSNQPEETSGDDIKQTIGLLRNELTLMHEQDLSILRQLMQIHQSLTSLMRGNMRSSSSQVFVHRPPSFVRSSGRPLLVRVMSEPAQENMDVTSGFEEYESEEDDQFALSFNSTISDPQNTSFNDTECRGLPRMPNSFSSRLSSLGVLTQQDGSASFSASNVDMSGLPRMPHTLSSRLSSLGILVNQEDQSTNSQDSKPPVLITEPDVVPLGRPRFTLGPMDDIVEDISDSNIDETSESRLGENSENTYSSASEDIDISNNNLKVGWPVQKESKRSSPFEWSSASSREGSTGTSNYYHYDTLLETSTKLWREVQDEKNQNGFVSDKKLAVLDVFL